MSRSTCPKALLVLFAIFMFAPSPVAGSEEYRDVIIVIDISTSMSDRIEMAKTEAIKVISSARPGDRVAIITFGSSVHLLERRRINSRTDILALASAVDPLQAVDVNTNLPLAMQRSLQELHQLYEDSADRNRVLVWLSDDRNNPPPDLPEPITFKTLKQKQLEQLPDEKWFEFSPAIEPEVESDMEWFVGWANRNPMELRVEAVDADMGILFTSDLQRHLSVSFTPDSKAVWGTILMVTGEITDGASRTPVVIDPPVIVCDGAEWSQDLSILFPRKPGNYTCTIRFSSPAEKALRISPAEIVLKARIQPEMKTIASATNDFADTASEYDVPSRIRPLTTRGQMGSPETAEDFEQLAAEEGLLFESIKPGNRYTQRVHLYPTENVPVESIEMKTNLALPAGLGIQSAFSVVDGVLVADMVLAAADNCQLPEDCDLRGNVSFVSSVSRAEIFPASVPVRITTKEKGMPADILEPPPPVAKTRRFSIEKSFFALLPKVPIFLAVVLLVAGVLYTVKQVMFRPRLFGSLERINNTNGAASHFDLQKIGKRGSIVIGKSENADITLTEPGVDELHALLVPMVTRAGNTMFVRPLSQSRVLVNRVQYAQPKEIVNGDFITIGSAVFVYKCRPVSREAIVEFLTGNCMRGTLISWDVDAPEFKFLPKDASSDDEALVISFSEIKTISFLSKKSRFPFNRSGKANQRNRGRPLEVVLQDGQLLEGYGTIESNTWNKRFYLIPKETREIALILIERASVQHVFEQSMF
ncbi:MAG: VWA domain-containing protein [Candidatus Abyssobacteria bacterium SURF_5]|uniref:VWA domain-containing protein n=1 Tax=Abyssobacteria bacterium (strain SURF_5) TaxID=2093360 RepID=A0A3A4P9L2_ABYX5|nr:MAG: VWA domain-containing protein [Candidatus Abyssubacteria bacterium SURF_5]